MLLANCVVKRELQHYLLKRMEMTVIVRICTMRNFIPDEALVVNPAPSSETIRQWRILAKHSELGAGQVPFSAGFFGLLLYYCGCLEKILN